MAITLSATTSELRNQLSEQTDGRFLSDANEIKGWVWEACREINRDLKILKRTHTITGSAYQSMPGQIGQRFYRLPDDFICADANFGMMQNNLRRRGMTNREFFNYQPQAITDWRYSNATIDERDFFGKSPQGLIFHYSLDYFNADDIDAGGSGKLGWFVPVLADTDIAYLGYISDHGDPSTSIYLPDWHKMMIVYKACMFAATKFMNASRGHPRILEMFTALYGEQYRKAEDYYNDLRKVPDSQNRAKGPHEVGLYRSRRNRRYYGYGWDY